MDEHKVRKHILDRTEERIYTEGFVGFTMDDVAADAGVSKKTLYRIFPSKNDLILMVVNRKIDGVEKKQKAVIENPDLGFQEKVDGIIRIVSKVLVQIKRKTVRDLVRLSPDLWETVRERRRTLMKGMMKILEEGREKGLVRRDLPSEFILTYFLRTIDEMISPQTAMEVDMTPRELLEGVLTMFFHGVLSGKEEEAQA